MAARQCPCWSCLQRGASDIHSTREASCGSLSHCGVLLQVRSLQSYCRHGVETQMIQQDLANHAYRSMLHLAFTGCSQIDFRSRATNHSLRKHGAAYSVAERHLAYGSAGLTDETDLVAAVLHARRHSTGNGPTGSGKKYSLFRTSHLNTEEVTHDDGRSR